jgi:alkanesulfonate monooxygenase SsuD/methylene tetrahydromethanopterin reductase-like flavin-dependent oxidoreductase (luciferase family)
VSAPTRWGLWLHADRPLATLGDVAAHAERRGAAAILVADEGTDRDLYVTLAVLAARTRRVQLVAAVTNPHSRHPVATAAALAAVAELAPGRVVAGFGAGGSRVFGPMGFAPARPFTALVECVDVVEALLGGETVDHTGEFVVHGASLPWSAGRMPIAIAGRGPRVERLAAERADWLLLAGRPIDAVGQLVDRLRAHGQRTRGRAPAIAWNPTPAWTDAMREEVRAHLGYMGVDMPAAERSQVLDSMLERYAVVGDRPTVIGRLSGLRERVRPELFVFDAHDYTLDFVEEIADVGGPARGGGAGA